MCCTLCFLLLPQILHAYSLSHHIVPPFKVAVDGEFLQSALAGQILLKEQLPKLLQEERTTVYTTVCVNHWLRAKGTHYAGALFIASKLAHLKCRHDKGFGEWEHKRSHADPMRLLPAVEG
jgi:rRNA-processing protein FCF1